MFSIEIIWFFVIDISVWFFVIDVSIFSIFFLSWNWSIFFTIIVFELIASFSNENFFDSLNCLSSKFSFDKNLTIIEKIEIIEKMIEIFEIDIFEMNLKITIFFAILFMIDAC